MHNNIYDIIIGRITHLSSTSINEFITEKREICCIISGININHIYELREWNTNIIRSDLQEIILKPQYLHSAAAIYTLVKFPHLRKDNSFIYDVLNMGCGSKFLKLAIGLLSQDEDGRYFMKNDFILKNAGIDDIY